MSQPAHETDDRGTLTKGEVSTHNVHFIMITYNQPQLTNLCMASLERALPESGVTHLWLVDNGSTPELASQWVGKLGGSWKTEIVRIAQNNFLMPAINKTVADALDISSNDPQRDVVIVSDNDIVWPTGSIRQLLDNLYAGKVDVACSTYHFEGRESIQNKIVYEYGWEPCSASLNAYEAWAREKLGQQIFEGFNSSCFATWGRIWKQVGPFDEVFKFVCNDIDWRWRAILWGVKIGIFENNPIFHKQAATRMIGMADSQNAEDMFECCAKWECTWDEITLGDPPTVLLAPTGILYRTLSQNHKILRNCTTYRIPSLNTKPIRSRPNKVIQPAPPNREYRNGGRVLPKLGSNNSRPVPSKERIRSSLMAPAAHASRKNCDLIIHGNWDPCDGYGTLNHDLTVAIKRLGVDVSFVPMHQGTDARKHSSDEFLSVMHHNARSSLCFSIMAPDNPRLHIRHYRTPGNHVLYTMFESTLIPDGWSTNCNMYNAVWTPDDFCTQVFQRNGVFVPIETLCFGLNVEKWPLLQRELPQETGRPFRFLIYANADWGNIRKNFQLTLSAFRHAFGEREDVELVIKIMGSVPAIVASYRNVKVVTGRYTQHELLQLLQSVDCFLYPSNGEGYGLPPREAMLTGLPVVVSDWSSLTKLTKVEGLCYSIPIHELQDWHHQNWPGFVGRHAKIQLEDFSATLQQVANDHEQAKCIGMLSSRWVRDNEDINVQAQVVWDKLSKL